MATDPYYVDESKPWFTKEAGWPDEVPKNTTFEHTPLGDVLRQTAKEHPNKNVIWFQGEYMTFKELDEAVDRFATALHNLGLRKGDVLAMILPNCFQYVVGYYAAQRLGVISSGVNPTYKANEVRHQLKTINAKCLVVLDALYEGQIAPIRDDVPVRIYIKTNVTDMMKLPGWKKFLGKKLGKIPTGEVPDAKDFNDLMKTAPKLPDVKIDPDDVATYIMTGGTTGVPKAAMLTHFNCTSNTHQIKLWVFKIKPGAMIVGILPLYHSFAMTVVMNSCVRIGACMMLFPKPPSEDELCQTIQDIGPDDAVIYPGAEILFKRMSEFKDLDKYDIKGKLSVCVSGAGPLHRPVQEAFEKATGARLGEGYGLTEAGPVVSAHPFWGNRKIGTIGLPVPGTEWRIVELDDPKKEIPALTTIEKDGEVVPKSGEIICSGPQIMKGYLNQESDTAADIVEMEGKRWLLTGDIGFMDEHGRVTINDRKKQLIKNKGWSVFPSEVETLMMGHEAVTECAVAGIPDEKAGECIKAWCALKPEYQGKLTAEELMAWAKDNMTFYKVPTYVEIIDEIPKSPIGKVMRRELQEADPIYIAWKEKNAG